MGSISTMKAGVMMAVAVVVAMATCCWFLRPCPGRVKNAMGFDPECEAAFAAITNGIAQDFHRENIAHSDIIPRAYQTMNDVQGMTNAIFQLAVARHLAAEILTLNFTNENYRIRWQNLSAATDAICYANRCLWYANAPDMERCKFLFDALQRFKEGAIATLDEGPPSRSDDGRHGNDPFWAQGYCKKVAQKGLEGAPSYIDIGEFRLMYPRLSPEAQEYFKRRFREVFGLDYRPEENGKRPWLWGLDGTRWSGKDLEWH